MIVRRAVGIFLAAACLACCKPAANEKGTEATFNLPSALTEISGLAVAGPDSVFTHEDEHAIVYEIRLRDGHILRAFALGDPTIEGDFEGIATSRGHVYLITSDGLIYATDPGKNGTRVPYHVFDTGIGPRCEIEGLSEAPQSGALLVLCKRLRNGAEQKKLEIYLWWIGREHAEDTPWLSIPLKDFLDKDERAEFRPSGIEWDAARRHVLIVSGRNHQLLVLDERGALLEKRRLKPKRHPQTEGIAIMPDGRLVLADEGSKVRQGRLAVYPAP